MRKLISAALVTALVMAGMPAALADDDGDAPQLNESSMMKVALLADFLAGDDAEEPEVIAATTTVDAMRTSGIGWGALFKIYKLATAMDMDPAQLIAGISPDGEFDFGELKNNLTVDQRAVYDSLAKNFGTLVSGEKKADEAAAKAAAKAERKAQREAAKAARGNPGG